MSVDSYFINGNEVDIFITDSYPTDNVSFGNISASNLTASNITASTESGSNASFSNVSSSNMVTSSFTGSNITASNATINGIIHTTSGGIEFPDGSIQTTAATNTGSLGAVGSYALLYFQSTYPSNWSFSAGSTFSTSSYSVSYGGVCENLDDGNATISLISSVTVPSGQTWMVMGVVSTNGIQTNSYGQQTGSTCVTLCQRIS